MIDQILEKFNLKYDDLNPGERETLKEWTKALSKNKLNIQSVKKYIPAMRDSVERDLTEAELGSKQDLFLKARLRNYMLLEAFLPTPEKAREALERAIAGIAGRKK